jgi:hypothetical protein
MKLPVAKPTDAVSLDRLTVGEQRALRRAESTIAKGMKAFVAVGLAL